METTLSSLGRLIGVIQSLGGTTLGELGTDELLRPNGFIIQDMCLICGAEGEGCEPSTGASPALVDGASSNRVTYLIGLDEYRTCPCKYSCPKGARIGDDPDDSSLSGLAAALLKEDSSLSRVIGDCGIAPSIIAGIVTG